MGIAMRYIYFFLLLMMTMLGFNIFLSVRDSKLVDSLKTRKQVYCEHLQELQPNHPDCKIE